MELGANGPLGLSVIRAAMVGKEKDIGSVTIRFLYTEELAVREIDMKLKTATLTGVLVSEGVILCRSSLKFTFTLKKQEENGSRLIHCYLK